MKLLDQLADALRACLETGHIHGQALQLGTEALAEANRARAPDESQESSTETPASPTSAAEERVQFDRWLPTAEWWPNPAHLAFQAWKAGRAALSAAAVPDEAMSRVALEAAENACARIIEQYGGIACDINFHALAIPIRRALSTPAAPAPTKETKMPESLAPNQPLESNLRHLAENPQTAIEAFGAEWAGRCAQSALDAIAAPVVPEPLTDEQQRVQALIKTGAGQAQRLSEVAAFLRGIRAADEACDCDRVVRWIDGARAALAATPAPKREPGWNGPMLDSTSEAP